MRKLPHHVHNQEEIVSPYGETLPIQVIPQIDWQRMAADAWAGFLTQLGTMTPAQVGIVIETWNKLVDPAALGDLMGEIVKVGTGTLKWLSDFFTGYNTNDPKVDFSKLSIIPYKLPTSAYNYILNPSYEYGAWGGSDTQSEDYAKFGRYSGKLVAVGSDVDGGWSNYIDVRGLTELTVSVWMKVTSFSGGSFQTWIEYYDSSKVYIADSMLEIGELEAVTDWTQKTLTDSDLPSGACFARVRNVWRDTPTGTGYVDGWQFNVGDQTPVFQDFTGYSHKWMPEKIETSQSSVYAWSYDTWTDVLELTFECESKMICMVSAWANGDIHNNSAGAGSCAFYMDLTLDDDAISVTQGEIGNSNLPAGDYAYGVYSGNPILIVEKGIHTIKLRLRAGDITNAIAHVNNRRLIVLKGFYQGGAS